MFSIFLTHNIKYHRQTLGQEKKEKPKNQENTAHSGYNKLRDKENTHVPKNTG